MQLSKRISSLSPSPTVALNAQANAMKAQGINVLNFGVGEPDFPTPQAIVDRAIAALNAGKTKYGPAGGNPLTRKAISEKLKRENQLDFNPDQVVVGIGAKEILFHIFLATLNEGDEVLLPAPYWVSYSEQILAAGGTPVLIPMPEGTDAYRLTPELIEPHVTPKTRAFVLTSPNNPAGYVLSQEDLQSLGNYLTDKPWWIISDEIYEYLTFDSEHISLLALTPALKDRFILVNGLSKGFAMTGWRVGYCAAPLEVAKLVKSLQSHSSTCLPPFVEEAACLALEQGKELVKEDLQVFARRRDLAVRCLDAIDEIRYIRPQGAFYVFVDVRQVLEKSSQFKALDTLAFSRWLLEVHHLAAVPGEAFGTPGFIRFSYATSDSIIEEGFRRFAEAIHTALHGN